MFDWNRMREISRALSIGEVVSVRSLRSGWRITCMEGRLWVTVTGGESDTVLGAGEEMTSACSGRIVIQALCPASVRVQPLARRRVNPPMLSPQPAH